jgi:hypothetical protein
MASNRASRYFAPARSVPAGAAACDEDVETAEVSQRPERDRGKLRAKVLVEGDRCRDRSRVHPARIRVLLVLLPDSHRNLVIDGGQARNGIAQLQLFAWLAHLLLHDICDRRRPGTLEQRSRIRQRMQRKIHCSRGNPGWRDVRGALQRLHKPPLQSLRLLLLLRRGREHVFVEETLPRPRAAEAEHRLLDIIVCGRGVRGRNCRRMQARRRSGSARQRSGRQHLCERDRRQLRRDRKGTSSGCGQALRPSVPRAPHALRQRRIDRFKHGADTGEVCKELRPQIKHLRQTHASFFQLALREIDQAEIVAGISMAGL